MADTLIGKPGLTAELSEAVVNMAPGLCRTSFLCDTVAFLDKAIHAPIELPSGEKKNGGSGHKTFHGAGSSQG